jgi:hypothetical protein
MTQKEITKLRVINQTIDKEALLQSLLRNSAS